MTNDGAAVGHQVIRGLPENLPVLILRQAAARISPRSVCALQQHQRKSIDGHHEIDVAAFTHENGHHNFEMIGQLFPVDLSGPCKVLRFCFTAVRVGHTPLGSARPRLHVSSNAQYASCAELRL